MRRVLLALVTLLVSVTSALAVPDLQLYIPGAVYTGGGAEDPESWVTTSSSFDLYLVGQADINDVLLAVALGGFDEGDDLSGVSVTINGMVYDDWTWGNPPLATVDNGPPGDLAGHGIYDTYFLEFAAGDFDAVGLIGDTNEGWDPSNGYLGGGDTYGEIKVFSVVVTGAEWVHFDAYNLMTDRQGRTRIDRFAPPSHDAAFNGNGTTPIPEPTTMLLFGLGLAGTAMVRRFKR